VRKLWPIILFALLLGMPFALRAFVAGGAKQPVAAHDADMLRLVIISPHAESIRTEFADAFSRWHEKHYGHPVFIDYRIYGGSSDIVRYFRSAHDTVFKSLGTYQVDLVWGGGDDLFDRQLRKPGYLQGVRLPAVVMNKAFAQKTLAGLPLYDLSGEKTGDPPEWFGTALSSFGIVYNRDVVRELGLPEPKTWSDLADPRYRNQLILADPTRSGVAVTTFMVIVERAMQDAKDRGESYDTGWARGMGLVRQISANARSFSDGSTIVSSQIGQGDAAAGMAIDFHARSQIDAIQSGSGSSRLAYVEPANATAINPDPIALVKGAEHKELAIRFIEYVLSEQGQRLWNTRAGAPGGPRTTSLRRLPIMRSVYDNPVNFTDHVNPYKTTENFNTRRDRTATFGFIGELIRMSCIDPLNELRQTRSAVIASSRAQELDAKLGVFPFGQTEALRRMSLFSKADSLERLRLQRQWTEEFRDEYARLSDEAKSGRE
jgi:ABC-type Fe3+ transport system substrate-binding protein